MTGGCKREDLRPGARPIDRLRAEIPHPAPFCLQLTVDRQHIHEAVDHVPNVQYVQWIDRAAELHADAVGFDHRRMLAADVMWFVARHEIDYCAETGLGEELIVATWVENMRRVKSWRSTLIARAGDGTVVLRARTLWALVNLSRRRPVRAWPEMIEAFAPAAPGSEGPVVCTSR